MTFYQLNQQIKNEAKAEGPGWSGNTSCDDIIFNVRNNPQFRDNPEVHAALEAFEQSHRNLGKALRKATRPMWDRVRASRGVLPPQPGDV